MIRIASIARVYSVLGLYAPRHEPPCPPPPPPPPPRAYKAPAAMGFPFPPPALARGSGLLLLGVHRSEPPPDRLFESPSPRCSDFQRCPPSRRRQLTTRADAGSLGRRVSLGALRFGTALVGFEALLVWGSVYVVLGGDEDASWLASATVDSFEIHAQGPGLPLFPLGTIYAYQTRVCTYRKRRDESRLEPSITGSLQIT